MYVDVISYYHKVKNTYKIKQDAYYSKVINYGNKTGYLEITEDNGKYFVEFVFNYAKIESLTDKDNLVKVIDNMCYVLRSTCYVLRVACYVLCVMCCVLRFTFYFCV